MRITNVWPPSPGELGKRAIHMIIFCGKFRIRTIGGDKSRPPLNLRGVSGRGGTGLPVHPRTCPNGLAPSDGALKKRRASFFVAQEREADDSHYSFAFFVRSEREDRLGNWIASRLGQHFEERQVILRCRNMLQNSTQLFRATQQLKLKSCFR